MKGRVGNTHLAVLGLVLLTIGIRTLSGAHHAGLAWVISSWWIDGECGVVGVVAAGNVRKFAGIVEDTGMKWLLAACLVASGVLGPMEEFFLVSCPDGVFKVFEARRRGGIPLAQVDRGTVIHTTSTETEMFTVTSCTATTTRQAYNPSIRPGYRG